MGTAHLPMRPPSRETIDNVTLLDRAAAQFFTPRKIREPSKPQGCPSQCLSLVSPALRSQSIGITSARDHGA